MDRCKKTVFTLLNNENIHFFLIGLAASSLLIIFFMTSSTKFNNAIVVFTECPEQFKPCEETGLLELHKFGNYTLQVTDTIMYEMKADDFIEQIGNRFIFKDAIVAVDISVSEE